jgi:hypothetical protein
MLLATLDKLLGFRVVGVGQVLTRKPSPSLVKRDG